jgi:hypothetical protein
MKNWWRIWIIGTVAWASWTFWRSRIEKDVFMWRVKAMLGHPPNWRLNMIAGPRSAGRPLDRLDLRYAAD